MIASKGDGKFPSIIPNHHEKSPENKSQFKHTCDNPFVIYSHDVNHILLKYDDRRNKQLL